MASQFTSGSFRKKEHLTGDWKVKSYNTNAHMDPMAQARQWKRTFFRDWVTRKMDLRKEVQVVVGSTWLSHYYPKTTILVSIEWESLWKHLRLNWLLFRQGPVIGTGLKIFGAVCNGRLYCWCSYPKFRVWKCPEKLLERNPGYIWHSSDMHHVSKFQGSYYRLRQKPDVLPYASMI